VIPTPTLDRIARDGLRYTNFHSASLCSPTRAALITGRTVPITLPWDETFDIGSDTGTPIEDSDYQVPFNFTGKLNRITVDLGASSVTPEALRTFQAQAAKRD